MLWHKTIEFDCICFRNGGCLLREMSYIATDYRFDLNFALKCNEKSKASQLYTSIKITYDSCDKSIHCDTESNYIEVKRIVE